jgi:hypothetical protein
VSALSGLAVSGVRFYWLVEDSGIADLTTETVIPDGCMEMIFHFGARFHSVLEHGPLPTEGTGLNI